MFATIGNENVTNARRVLQLQPDVFCCGIGKIGHFYGKKEAIQEDVAEAKRRFTMVLASITSAQKTAKVVLEEEGFELLRTFRNRNSGNQVHLYAHVS